MSGFRLTAEERARYDADGYLVRPAVLRGEALDRMRAASERVVADVVAAAEGERKVRGSYVQQWVPARHTALKWEGQTDSVMGIEPFAHLDEELTGFAFRPEIADPVRDLLGTDDLGLYTEKINLKRARDGRPVVLHQDAAYWWDCCRDVDAVVNAMVLLDDATPENGCLEVLPGSQRDRLLPGRDLPADDIAGAELDESTYDLSGAVPLAAPAGSVLWFGAYLLHRSGHNHSDADRRAVLYTLQPAGAPRLHELVASVSF